MALYIKDPDVDRLATELAGLRNTSKTEVVRLALQRELAAERTKPSLLEQGLAFGRDFRARGHRSAGQPVDKAFIDSLYGDP